MNLLSFMSFLILGITILTMVFGVLAYFLYKTRERKQNKALESYEQVLAKSEDDYLFFTKED